MVKNDVVTLALCCRWEWTVGCTCVLPPPGREKHCCSSGVTKATKENLCKIFRPETLPLGCDKVSEHQQASIIILLKKQECAGATHFHCGLCVSEWMQDCTRNDAALYRGCPKSPWLQEFANGKIEFWCFGFFAPEHNALPFFQLIGLI